MVGEARNQGRRDRELGLDRDITRRDFVGSTLVGSGMALLGFAAPGCRGTAEDTSEELLGMDVPDWGSYGGIGDYAESYGNTEAVVAAAHPVRTGQYRELDIAALDTGEVYDLVVVGGGFAGLSAALEFKRTAADGQTCLLLDNHPIFGGEAKRNEMLVDGVRLMGPQGWDQYPFFLDGGDRIGFTSERLGAGDVFVRPADGTGEDAPLVVDRHYKSNPSWSPGGQIAVWREGVGGEDIWVYSLEDPVPPRPRVVLNWFKELQRLVPTR